MIAADGGWRRRDVLWSEFRPNLPPVRHPWPVPIGRAPQWKVSDKAEGNWGPRAICVRRCPAVAGICRVKFQQPLGGQKIQRYLDCHCR